jgi:rhomboid protease GluP
MTPVTEDLEVPVSPRKERFFVSFLKCLATIGFLTFLFASVISEGRRADEVFAIYILSAIGGTLIGILLFGFYRQDPSSVLRIEPETIRWLSGRAGEVSLHYQEVWVAHKTGRGRREMLVLKAPEKAPIAIGTAFLPEPRMADSILEAVRARIALLPDGAQRLEGIATRQAVAERSTSEGRTVVFTLAVFLGLVFLAELATGALANPFLLWAFGANSFPLVKSGELFRLATANLLHGSPLHLLFNIMALVSLGSLLEPLLGRWRFLSVFLVSALAGAAGSAFLGHHVLAVGASTGIAGLIAAYAVVLWRWPDRLASPPTKRTWFWIGFAFLFPALTFHNVDHMGHLMGFLAGFALVFPETRKMDLVDFADRRRALFRGSAFLLVALFLAAGWIVIQRIGDPRRDLKAASTLLPVTSLSPLMTNSLAWKVAASPEASPAQLAAALRGIQRAVKGDPREVEIRDTLATVLYRLGRSREAVRTEYDLLSVDRTSFHVSQLARFEEALVRTGGPLLLGQSPAALPQARIASEGSVLVDMGDQPLPAGTILHFVLSSHAKPSALLEIRIGASGISPALQYSPPRNFLTPSPDEIFLALLDTRNTAGAANRATHWELQPIVPKAARLP